MSFNIVLGNPGAGFAIPMGSGTPAATSGALGTLTVSAPAATATAAVPAAATGAAPTVTLSAPLAAAAGAAQADGADPLVITVVGDIGGLGNVSGTVVVPLLDYAVAVSAPQAAAISGGANIAAPLAAVTVSAPRPTIAASPSGALATITTSAITGFAEEVRNAASGAVPGLAVTAPTASAVGQAAAVARNNGQDFLVLVRITPASASVISGDQGLLVTFPNDLTITPPQADAGPAVFTSGDVAAVAVSAPAAAAGVAVATGPATLGSDGDHYWARVAATAPQATATGATDFAVSFDLVVGVAGVPIAITNQGATLLVALPAAVTVDAFNGVPTVIATGDFGEAVQVNRALGSASIVITAHGAAPTVAVSAPSALVTIDGIGVNAPGGGASGGAAAAGALATLSATAPEAAASGAAPVVFTLRTFGLRAPLANVQAGAAAFANGSLASISLISPQAEATGEALAIAAMSPLTAQAPDGYADDGMEGHVRLKRTSVAGRAPTSLAPREVALNEADGALHHRSPTGEQTHADFAATLAALAPAGGEVGQVLGGDGGWRAPAPLYDDPIRLQDKGRFLLSDGAGQAVDAGVPAGRLLYRPFFVAKPVQISALSIDVSTAAAATAHLGLCRWNLDATPGAVITSGSVTCSVTGERAVAAPCFLTVGWYAAMCMVTGAEQPVLAGYAAPVAFDASLAPIGDPSAPAAGFDPAPTPDRRETFAHGFIYADTA